MHLCEILNYKNVQNARNMQKHKNIQSEVLVIIFNRSNKFLRRLHFHTYVNKNMNLHKNPQFHDMYV